MNTSMVNSGLSSLNGSTVNDYLYNHNVWLDNSDIEEEEDKDGDAYNSDVENAVDNQIHGRLVRGGETGEEANE